MKKTVFPTFLSVESQFEHFAVNTLKFDLARGLECLCFGVLSLAGKT